MDARSNMGKRAHLYVSLRDSRQAPRLNGSSRISLPMRSAGPRQGQVSRGAERKPKFSGSEFGLSSGLAATTRALNCTLNLATLGRPAMAASGWKVHRQPSFLDERTPRNAYAVHTFGPLSGRLPCQNAHILVWSGGRRKVGRIPDEVEEVLLRLPERALSLPQRA